MYTYRARTKENISGLSNAVMAIVNRVGSGKKVTIAGLDIRNVSCLPIVSTNVQGKADIIPISAVDGGSSINYTKLDSNNANLPSQVLILEQASSYTTDVTATVSGYMEGNINYRYNNSRGVFPTLSGGISDIAMSDYNIHSSNTNYQSVTLREGEGIVYRINTLFVSNFYRFHCLIRNTSTSATYSIDNEFNYRFDNEACIVIFNGTGSGVVLEICNFQIEENGNDDIPCFAVIPIDDIYNSTSDALTILKMDLANPDVPSTVMVAADGVVIPRGFKDGFTDMFCVNQDITFAAGVTQWQYWWDRTFPGQRYVITKYINSGASYGQALWFFQALGGEFDPANICADTPIILHEGEGLAIVQMQIDQVGTAASLGLTQKSSRFNYNVICTFGLEDENTNRSISSTRVIGDSPLIGSN